MTSSFRAPLHYEYLFSLQGMIFIQACAIILCSIFFPPSLWATEASSIEALFPATDEVISQENTEFFGDMAGQETRTAQEIEKRYDKARMAFLFGYYDLARQAWLPMAYDGHPRAQANIGWIYQTGKGAEKDLKKAFDWYLKAAKQGHAIAQNNLGVLHEKGWGIKASQKRAVYWYREAAEQGYSYAQFNYGKMLLDGAGVDKDAKEAAYWLGLAAIQGVADAKGLLIDKTKWGISSEHVANLPITPQVLDPKQQSEREILREAWILSQKPGNYTLQMISNKDEEVIIQYATNHQLPDQIAYFKSNVLGEDWYSVVYSSFPTFEAAQQKLTTLPSSLFRYKPWIRKFSDIHKAIKEPVN